MTEKVLSPQENRIQNEIQKGKITFIRHNRAGDILNVIRKQKPQIRYRKRFVFYTGLFVKQKVNR